MPELFAYTDGACSGNPGPGGWGVLLIARDGDRVLRERELHGGAADTTNNRMELQAAIAALEALPQIGVLDRLLRRGLPAVLLPAVDPVGDAVLQIGRIGHHGEGAGALQGLQRGDRGHQLHAVVGGLGRATGKLARFDQGGPVAGLEHHAPAAGAGIAGAGAVGIGEQLGHPAPIRHRRAAPAEP